MAVRGARGRGEAGLPRYRLQRAALSRSPPERCREKSSPTPPAASAAGRRSSDHLRRDPSFTKERNIYKWSGGALTGNIGMRVPCTFLCFAKAPLLQ